MKVSAGALADLPLDRAVAVGDGTVVVVRVGDEVAAFENRCLHKQLTLTDGRVHGGVLACPQHFWQYRLPEGRHNGGRGCLTAYAVEVTEDGEVVVDVTPPAPPRSMRERLLAHAREWSRDA